MLSEQGRPRSMTTNYFDLMRLDRHEITIISSVKAVLLLLHCLMTLAMVVKRDNLFDESHMQKLLFQIFFYLRLKLWKKKIEA